MVTQEPLLLLNLVLQHTDLDHQILLLMQLLQEPARQRLHQQIATDLDPQFPSHRLLFPIIRHLELCLFVLARTLSLAIMTGILLRGATLSQCVQTVEMLSSALATNVPSGYAQEIKLARKYIVR